MWAAREAGTPRQGGGGGGCPQEGSAESNQSGPLGGGRAAVRLWEGVMCGIFRLLTVPCWLLPAASPPSSFLSPLEEEEEMLLLLISLQ